LANKYDDAADVANLALETNPFGSILSNSHHVVSQLLPPEKTTGYSSWGRVGREGREAARDKVTKTRRRKEGVELRRRSRGL